MTDADLTSEITEQSRKLLSLAARLDAITGDALAGDVEQALRNAPPVPAGAPAELGAKLVALGTLRGEILNVALLIDAQPSTPVQIASDIADDFKSARNRLPLIVEGFSATQGDLLSSEISDDELNVLVLPSRDALERMDTMLRAIERAA